MRWRLYQLSLGLRFIAKILLNSLWGKFAQKNNLSHHLVFHKDDWASFHELVNNDAYDVHTPIFTTTEMVRVSYNDKRDFVTENENSNIVVAMYTTAMARLRLLKFLNMVIESPGCTPLYADTDSVMVKFPKGKCPIPEGDFLGDMCREYGNYVILKFRAAGPKY